MIARTNHQSSGIEEDPPLALFDPCTRRSSADDYKAAHMKQRDRSIVSIITAISMFHLAYAGSNAPGTTGMLEAAVGGKRTLVLADGPGIQDSHSMFFDALQVRILQCDQSFQLHCTYKVHS